MSSDIINLTCSACGSEKFEYPTNPKPDDNVICGGCGATSTYREIQSQTKEALDQLADDVTAKYTSIFKK